TFLHCCLYSPIIALSLRSALFPCTTLFRSLECGIYCDLCKVRREAERISSYTDLPIKEISFVGGELYPQSVFDALALLEVEADRSEEHTSELQSRFDLVCRLLLAQKNIQNT